MCDHLLQQIVREAVTQGPAVLAGKGAPFRRPGDVVTARGVSVDDKRAILTAWASDFYAPRSSPSLRHVPGTPEPVAIDEILTALTELDHRYGI